MGITLSLESPVGTQIQDTQLTPGQDLRVTGKTSGLIGPAPFEKVTMQLYDTTFASIQLDTTTNILGHYWFDIVLPNVQSKAKVTVTSDKGTETLNIGIGVMPDANKPPGVDWIKWLPWIAVGGGALLLIWTMTRQKQSASVASTPMIIREPQRTRVIQAPRQKIKSATYYKNPKRRHYR